MAASLIKRKQSDLRRSELDPICTGRITAVGLGDRYKKTQIYDSADCYTLEDEYQDYEEDNNEP